MQRGGWGNLCKCTLGNKKERWGGRERKKHLFKRQHKFLQSRHKERNHSMRNELVAKASTPATQMRLQQEKNTCTHTHIHTQSPNNIDSDYLSAEIIPCSTTKFQIASSILHTLVEVLKGDGGRQFLRWKIPSHLASEATSSINHINSESKSCFWCKHREGCLNFPHSSTMFCSGKFHITTGISRSLIWIY